MLKAMASTAAAGLMAVALCDPASAQVARINPSLQNVQSLPTTNVQMVGPNSNIFPQGRSFSGRTGLGNGGRNFGNRGGGQQFGGGGRGRQFGGGDGYRRHRGGGFGIGAGVAGLAAGALIGGAIASQAAPGYGYGYGDPAYGYGDPGYGYGYAQPQVPVETYADGAQAGGDAEGYCAQRFKSYDPASGTYLGYDGARHPCP